MMFGSDPEDFTNLWHVKRWETCVWGKMHYFGVPKFRSNHSIKTKMNYFWVSKLRSIHSTLLDPKWCLGVFRGISLTSACKKMKNLCFAPECTISGTEVAKYLFYSIRPKMMFGSVLKHFANLRHVQRCKTCVSGLNALFRGTEVANHPFYFIRPKMMFGSDPEDFTNIWHVKRWETCVWGKNALFWGTEVVKQPLYSIKTKMNYFWVSKFRSIHSTLLDPKWYLGVFWSISLTFGMYKDAKLVFRAWMHYFGVPKFRSINSTTLDPKWCLWVFRSISHTFGT
jgi:hypothetical protein